MHSAICRLSSQNSENAHPFRSAFDAVQLGGFVHPFSPLSSFPQGLAVKSLSPSDFSLSPVVKTVSPVAKPVTPIDFSLTTAEAIRRLA